MQKMSPLYNGIKLNCTIVSDTHIDAKHPVPAVPMAFLKSSLKDAKESVSPVDAYLTVGDTTSRGCKANWELTLKCFGKYSPAKKILLTVGNHDLWNDDGFDAALNEFRKYTKLICGREIDRPYYSDVINGYHFILLGNDEDAGCEANIGDEQFEWFKDEMAKAGKSGKPIFVFCHQSLNQKHGLPITWEEDGESNPDLAPDEGGIGARSDEIEAVLKSYKNVFYFSGHSHMGLGGVKTAKEKGFSSIEQEDSLTLINLPSLACGNHHGENRSMALGVQLEVYEDKVVIRPRNYFRHKWVTDVELQDGKPYFTVKL